MIKYFKWISWFIIFILSFRLYKHSKIRFSYSKHSIYYYIFMTVLLFNISYCHLLTTFYPLHPNLTNYWYYLLIIFGILAINIIYHKPIINDNTFNPPPKFIKKSYKYTYITILTLILFNITTEYFKFKFFNTIHKFLYFSFFINFIIFSYLFYHHKHFNSCKYNLPYTWN
jgi:hypothetical protein